MQIKNAKSKAHYCAIVYKKLRNGEAVPKDVLERANLYRTQLNAGKLEHMPERRTPRALDGTRALRTLKRDNEAKRAQRISTHNKRHSHQVKIKGDKVKHYHQVRTAPLPLARVLPTSREEKKLKAARTIAHEIIKVFKAADFTYQDAMKYFKGKHPEYYKRYFGTHGDEYAMQKALAQWRKAWDAR